MSIIIIIIIIIIILIIITLSLTSNIPAMVGLTLKDLLAAVVVTTSELRSGPATTFMFSPRNFFRDLLNSGTFSRSGNFFKLCVR